MFAAMRLGRRSPPPGSPAPQLDPHLRRALPPPPLRVDRSIVPGGWIMGANDRVGDCTIVACANAVLTWTAANGAPWRVSDERILARYAALTGYAPGQPETDTGAVETDVLRAWSSHGWDTGRPTIDALLWARIDPRNRTAVRQTIHLFGGAYLGLTLPLSAQDQPVWDVPATGLAADGAPGSWGGHAVWVAGYDADGLICITWGQAQRMTWGFFAAYCDEAYALLDRNDWLDTHGLAMGAVDFDTLAG